MQEFHEDLAVKNKEMERLAVAAAAAAGRPLPSDADAVGARVAVLHNKWRTVWRLSADRKKLLQDTLDHLLEVRTVTSMVAREISIRNPKVIWEETTSLEPHSPHT